MSSPAVSVAATYTTWHIAAAADMILAGIFALGGGMALLAEFSGIVELVFGFALVVAFTMVSMVYCLSAAKAYKMTKAIYLHGDGRLK